MARLRVIGVGNIEPDIPAHVRDAGQGTSFLGRYMILHFLRIAERNRTQRDFQPLLRQIAIFSSISHLQSFEAILFCDFRHIEACSAYQYWVFGVVAKRSQSIVNAVNPRNRHGIL
jgi:hypothetical protein